jgi:hypothetical protein
MQSNDQRRCVHPVEPSGELTWGVGIFQSFIMSATMEMNATRDSYSKHYDYTTGEMSNDSQGSGTDNWCVLPVGFAVLGQPYWVVVWVGLDTC